MLSNKKISFYIYRVRLGSLIKNLNIKLQKTQLLIIFFC